MSALSEEAHAQVPLSVLQALGPAAEKLGLSLPGMSRFAPTINVTIPIRDLALELGRLVSAHHIYLFGDRVVTVDGADGKIRTMTPRRFPGWCEEFCTFHAPGTRRERDSLNVNDAAQLLEMDNFRTCLRPLKAVNKMSLPVLREGGEVVFLPPGYDAETETLTLGLIEYDMEWRLGQSQGFFLDFFGTFPWNKRDDEKGGLENNRSFSVHLAAMVGAYCRGFFSPGTLMPIIAYFANKPGTGKTRICETVWCPIYGFAAATGTPKDDEKMDVKLATAAQALKPYLIFDDIGGGLRSNSLNRWTSESYHQDRKFHSNSEMFELPNVTQVFVTANDLKTSEDISRRALIAELFLDTEVKGRVFKRRVTPTMLASEEIRKEFLSALCGFVKHWDRVGRPLHNAPLETFEEWTQIVGGIVMACEFYDPLLPPEGVVGGAQDEDEIKELLLLVATEKEGDGDVTRCELMQAARQHGLLEDLLGVEGEFDDTMNKRFGRRMRRWRGQKLKDNKDRLFRFSHKRKNTGANYPLEFLS
ncbi:MAG: hypothetical protein ACOYNN_04095 [Terrimicrobiaceae bacterium]